MQIRRLIPIPPLASHSRILVYDQRLDVQVFQSDPDAQPALASSDDKDMRFNAAEFDLSPPVPPIRRD